MTTGQEELQQALANYSGSDPEPDPETPQDDPDTVSPVSPSQPGPTYSPPNEEPEPDAEVSRDIDAIVGNPSLITLESGLEVHVLRLKTRQFFALMRIVTNGAMPALMSMQIDFDLDDDAFMNRLLTVVLMAVPDSEQQTIEFIQMMCEPVGLNQGNRLTKTQIQENADKQMALDRELANPELGDMITIMESVIRQESEDIKGLGKRLKSMWTLAQKAGLGPRTGSGTTSESSTQAD